MSDSKNIPAKLDELSVEEQSLIDKRLDEYVAAMRRGEDPGLDSLQEGLSENARRLVRQEAFSEKRVLERKRLDNRLAKDFDLSRSLVEYLGDGDSSSFESGSPNLHTSPGESPPKVTNYELVGVLGRGGTANVYLATHYRLRRPVALKCPRALASEMSSEQLIKTQHRFLREARIQAQVASPAVPVIYEVDWTTDELPIIAMEPVLGDSFESKLVDRDLTRIDRENLEHVASVCRALNAAHQQRFFHLDIKPQNICFTTDGVLKILDWGFGREPGTVVAPDTINDDKGETQVSQLGGTLFYMSPEQARAEWDSLSPKSDSFAVGAILNEVLTGRKILPADATSQELIARTANCEIDDALDFLKDKSLPPELVEMTTNCLSSFQSDRPNALEIAEKIEDYFAEIDAEDRKAKEETLVLRAKQEETEQRLLTEKKLRSRTLWGSTGAAILLAMITLGSTYYYLDRQDQVTQEHDRITVMEQNVTTVSVKIFEAINEDDLTLARAGYSKLKAYLADSPPEHLVEIERQIGSDLAIADKIDQIRQERTLRMFSELLPANISRRKYSEFFETTFGGSVGSSLGEKISSTRLQVVYARALQDWYLLEKDNGIKELLLSALEQSKVDMSWLAKIDPKLSYEELRALAIPQNNELASPYRVEKIVSKLPNGDTRAIQLLRLVESEHPDDFWIQLALAAHLNDSSGVDRETKLDLQAMALAHARSAISINESSDAALFAFALLCTEQGLLDELNVLSDLTDLNQNRSWIRQAVLALRSEAKGQFGKALKHWKEACSIEPSIIFLKQAKASTLFSTGAVVQAEQLATELLETNPNNTHALNILVNIKMSSDLDAAHQLALRILELEPSETNRQLYALILAKEGRFYEAVEIFDDVGLGKVKHPQIFIVASISALLKGEKEKALAEAESVHNSTEFWLGEMFYAIALGQNGRWNDASNHFDDAIKDFKAAGTSQKGLGGFMGTAKYQLTAMNLRNTLQFETDKETYLPAEWGEVKRTYMDNPTLKLKVSWMPGFADFFLSNDKHLHATLIYKMSTPPGSYLASQTNLTVMQGTYNVVAARAAAQGSVTFDNKTLHGISDKDRDRCRDLAFSWLESEIKACKRTVSRKKNAVGKMMTFIGGKAKADAGINLSLMMLHRDFEPIRSPIFVNQMSESDRDRARKIWQDVKELYETNFETEISFPAN